MQVKLSPELFDLERIHRGFKFFDFFVGLAALFKELGLKAFSLTADEPRRQGSFFLHFVRQRVYFYSKR